MFGGFDPSGDPDRSFFERRRWQSLLAALGLVGGTLGYALWLASREEPVEIEEEIVDAEVQNFEMEEEPEEPEPEPEPPPPEPPTSDPTPKKSKPTPQPDIRNPDEIDQNPDEGKVDDSGPTGGGGGGNDQGKPKAAPAPEPKPEPKVEPKPKPKPKKLEIDDTKPIERPATATVPKKVGGDAPVYPEDLRKRNVTGKVKVKLTIYKDGSVKGAKVLAKENSVDPAEDPELHELANKLFLKAVQKALPTWTYEPSKYEGKPITVYLTIVIPFSLE